MEHMLNRHQLHLFLWVSKQWGNLWAGYTEVLNWYFPLTTSQVYAVCLTKHTKNISSGHNWEPARIEEWNNSYARIHPDGDLGYSVIAICKAQQQWGMMVNQATTFTYPIAFSSNNVLAFKQAKSNSNGNNYLMREAGIGIPNNISVSLPGTSPALSFYVFVIGW